MRKRVESSSDTWSTSGPESVLARCHFGISKGGLDDDSSKGEGVYPLRDGGAQG